MDRDDAETIRTPVAALLADEMQSIRGTLDALPDSPRCRELRGRLRTYEVTFESRARLPMPQSQRWALLELVFELREQTADYSASCSSAFAYAEGWR